MNAHPHESNRREPDGATLTAYALDQLEPAERAVIEAHLGRSKNTRQVVEQTRALGRHLAEVGQSGPCVQRSAALREAIEQRFFRAEDPAAAPMRVPSRCESPKVGRRRWAALAVAICLLIGATPLYWPEGAERPVAMPTGVDGPAVKTEPVTARRDVLKRYGGDGDRSASSGVLAHNQEASTPAALGDADTAAIEHSLELQEHVARLVADRTRLAEMATRGNLNANNAAFRKLREQVRFDYAQLEQSGQPLQRQFTAETVAGAYIYTPDGGQPGPASPTVAPSVLTASGGSSLSGHSFSHDPLLTTANGTLHTGYAGSGSAPQAGMVRMPVDTTDRLSVLVSDPTGVHLDSQGSGSPQPYRTTAAAIRPGGRHVVHGGPASVPSPGTIALYDSGASRRGEEIAGSDWRYQSGGEHERFEQQRPVESSHAGETPGTEQYDPIVENAFVPVSGKMARSTLAVDVDTASYANVRRFLNHGQLPPSDAVRIEEMVNYFRYDYPLPEGDVPFSVNVEVAECPWNGRHRLLRVGLKGQEIDRSERGPGNLVFLLDVSGSMRDEDKLPLVKQAMTMLVDQLTEDDRVAIVTYASGTEVKLESTCGSRHDTILDAVESLQAGGSTHGSAGIQLAYDRATSHFVEGGTNRVILATDGDLNVGITDDDALVKLIRDKAKTGVFLTVLGFGTGNLKDAKLEKLADKGNGSYAYIDSLSEADKVLVEQLSGSLVTIAKDVKVQIEFNPAEVHSYRLIGYENRTMPARDFRNDRKDAGEIGAGHTVTALYEVVPADGQDAKDDADSDRPDRGKGGELKYQRVWQRDLTDEVRRGEMLTLWLRYKLPDEDESKELEFVAKDDGKRFGEASADFRFASAVAAFGMVLRGSEHCGDVTLSAVEEFAAGALGDDSQGRRAEFAELVRRARQLRGQ
ncbi:MAG: von Willebrand factor type A domain-containing protein [Pirellulales bacterium]|nr:von Willebrand factor type A domain-containing protein [Pirellulales bacterium]